MWRMLTVAWMVFETLELVGRDQFHTPSPPSSPNRFNPGKESDPDIYWRRSWVNCRISLEVVAKTRIPATHTNGTLVVQLVTSQYSSVLALLSSMLWCHLKNDIILYMQQVNFILQRINTFMKNITIIEVISVDGVSHCSVIQGHRKRWTGFNESTITGVVYLE